MHKVQNYYEISTNFQMLNYFQDFQNNLIINIEPLFLLQVVTN